ncbi:MAG: penicillin-insensitive murein endopeptidase [Pseudobdellovibrionaceae bacterium]
MNLHRGFGLGPSSKKQFPVVLRFLSLMFTTFLFFALSGCSPGGFKVNDQQAPALSSHVIQTPAVQTQPQGPSPADGSSGTQTRPYPRLPVLGDVHDLAANNYVSSTDLGIQISDEFIEADFRTKIVQMRLSLKYDNRTYHKVIRGSFNANGIAVLLELSENSDRRVILGIARCIDLCANVIIDVHFRRLNGGYYKKQYQSNVENFQPDFGALQDNPGQLPTDAAAGGALDSTADGALDPDEDAPTLLEAQESESVPGEYMTPQVAIEKLDEIIQALDDTSSQLPRPAPVVQVPPSLVDQLFPVPQVQPSQTTPPSTQVTPPAPNTQPDPSSPPTQTVITPNPGTTTAAQPCNNLAHISSIFPCSNLGAQYPGKAMGYYGNYNTSTKTNPNPGRLVNGTSIAGEGTGFKSKRFESPNYRFQFSAGITLKVLEYMASQFHQTVNDIIRIGDITRQNGGHTPPHVSHQNGLDVDVTMPKLQNGRVDFEKAWILLKAAFRTGLIHRVGTVQANKNEICKVAKAKGEFEANLDIFRNIAHWQGHDRHFHFRMKCTTHNQQTCRIDASVVTAVGCP